MKTTKYCHPLSSYAAEFRKIGNSILARSASCLCTVYHFVCRTLISKEYTHAPSCPLPKIHPVLKIATAFIACVVLVFHFQFNMSLAFAFRLREIVDDFFHCVHNSDFDFEIESRRRTTSFCLVIRVKYKGASRYILKSGFLVRCSQDIDLFEKYLHHLKSDWPTIFHPVEDSAETETED